MDMREGTLAGKVAIVSGSGRGIGQAIAMKLAAAGASVVVNDIDAEPAEKTVAEIRSQGGTAIGCPGSVTDDGFAKRFVTSAVTEFGGLDIIVNNAGYTWDSVIQKMTDEQWDAILDVHLKAPFQILRAAQPIISSKAKEEARLGAVTCRKVVNVSSLAGTGGNAGQVNYSSAKAAIIGLTKAMSKEWGRYNVTVNAVAFGLIRTRMTQATAGEAATIDIAGRTLPAGINGDLLADMTRSIPLGRAGTPEDAAGAVYLLTLPESDYVSGQVLVCSGGYNL